ncbi:hypothetical protein A11A3_07013 [Alcanivorax hongdengensis A-11-3]|uniref:Uncharacterized protein n=1 Tax=Alcanivorax hongdengensis A-11-3 TaxID=1177179 RepID=L0WDA8_9GAMM|nr:hypothetical protein A11A3_07013 [Alcanivorax hongdengensis A-11-3]
MLPFVVMVPGAVHRMGEGRAAAEDYRTVADRRAGPAMPLNGNDMDSQSVREFTDWPVRAARDKKTQAGAACGGFSTCQQREHPVALCACGITARLSRQADC